MAAKAFVLIETQVGKSKEVVEAIRQLKGVKSVELDDETKIVTITYKTAKTNPEKLRKAISKLGYDADDVEADAEAYAKLPKCCKKDVAPH